MKKIFLLILFALAFCFAEFPSEFPFDGKFEVKKSGSLRTSQFYKNTDSKVICSLEKGVYEVDAVWGDYVNGKIKNNKRKDDVGKSGYTWVKRLEKANGVFVVTGEGVTMRSGPSKKSSSVAFLFPGAEINVEGVKITWVHLKGNKDTPWKGGWTSIAWGELKGETIK